MSKAALLAAVIALIAAMPARADYQNRLIGNWLVSAEEDRFGDGGTFIALTGKDGVGLGVRCLRKVLSVGIVDMSPDPKPLDRGAKYSFSFRVDKSPVVETEGIAISERLIQVKTEKSLVKNIRDGKETAVKIVDPYGTSSVSIFKTTGAPKAFADLSKECPLD
ncbi:hypothetical protein [Bradyrhizobium sp. NAS96.2]|uniref:hypothetical protein n=1 Tax=Bradyrhizobium sp. NAS96.2 TaxID=1680160 RepID=UPI00093BA4FB|nr:hypothetical protein [Bradyrhizobium sp. NAS96.2]OKO69887.1 hypothetical protein AC628_32215 [Bradyrhizobium sp. NAS96.2]